MYRAYLRELVNYKNMPPEEMERSLTISPQSFDSIGSDGEPAGHDSGGSNQGLSQIQQQTSHASTKDQLLPGPDGGAKSTGCSVVVKGSCVRNGMLAQTRVNIGASGA
ncbi:hypothetical protein PoB_000955200 [Plakobranchus ocellatus]|uniref:Uncharacterized protein n=1 Tax=Plakobranchus ocellatus TaxID=259542 RepID=A0AAV3YLM6_9GAST|nr:hypothetical protein PoB_000955200 [Plakobranchus ocellatus]